MPTAAEPTTPTGERPAKHTGRRIVLTTFGSLGDVHPYIAVALGLQARGHEVLIATSDYFRQKIEAHGIGFRPVRPDRPDLDANPDLARRIMDARKGGEYIIRDMMMSVLQESYEDTLAAAEGADLLVSHVLTFTTRLVAEKKGIPWTSTFLQPMGFFSAYDPPVLAPAPYLSRLRFLGPTFHRLLFRCARWSVRSWSEPWHRLRAEIGLPPTSECPLFEGQHSPFLVLAMFSPLIAAKQPDWPLHTVVCGFPFHDQDSASLSPELVRFLEAGPSPLVFTLGSSSALAAGPFYEHSAAAAKLLGRRAILILGDDTRNRPASLPEGVVAFDYVPFAELFPRAAAIVHSGGIGSTGLAMRAGRPMLVVPCAHDQPDNAARATRLGIARTISQQRYNPTRAAAVLRHLLDNPMYSQRAAEIGAKVRQEDGVGAACDALEALLRAGRTGAAVAN